MKWYFQGINFFGLTRFFFFCICTIKNFYGDYYFIDLLTVPREVVITTYLSLLRTYCVRAVSTQL